MKEQLVKDTLESIDLKEDNQQMVVDQ